MLSLRNVRLPLEYDDETLRRTAAGALGVCRGDIKDCRIVRRAVDARNKAAVVFSATLEVTLSGIDERAVAAGTKAEIAYTAPYRPAVISAEAGEDERPIVVGSGPAGLFAALLLTKAGARPIVLERGGDLAERKAAVDALRCGGVLDKECNMQFGAGGAGTFSDGKLNSGISDPRCRYVLEQLAAFADAPDILWQAKPHLGTDRLERAVTAAQKEILAGGGEVRYRWRLEGLIVRSGALCGVAVMTPGGRVEWPCRRMVLAIGHSARDTAAMLYASDMPMTAKPFAVGVRIEHRQEDIDAAQYGSYAGHPALGAAAYKLHVTPKGGRGVYTFCMCPGGEVVAAASEEHGLAVNGMSRFARDGAHANSALLVGVTPQDFGEIHPLAGFAFQRRLERSAYTLGGGGYCAPVQRIGDFLRERPSARIVGMTPSYKPGVTPANLRDCLPSFVADNLAAALPALGRQLRGFDHPDALLYGVESRTSSPVRMTRGADGQSAVRGIYPCGEGAGYAGGILSAAVDGMRTAERVLAQAAKGL